MRAIIERTSLTAAGKRREPRPLPRLKKDLEDVVEAKKEASIGNVRLKLRHKKSSTVGGQLGTAHVKVHVQVCHTALITYLLALCTSLVQELYVLDTTQHTHLAWQSQQSTPSDMCPDVCSWLPCSIHPLVLGAVVVSGMIGLLDLQRGLCCAYSELYPFTE